MKRLRNHLKWRAGGFETGDIGKDGWFERLSIVTKKELRERSTTGFFQTKLMRI